MLLVLLMANGNKVHVGGQCIIENQRNLIGHISDQGWTNDQRPTALWSPSDLLASDMHPYIPHSHLTSDDICYCASSSVLEHAVDSRITLYNPILFSGSMSRVVTQDLHFEVAPLYCISCLRTKTSHVLHNHVQLEYSNSSLHCNAM